MSAERSDTAAGELVNTGERFMPEAHGNIELEHLHRYLQACEIAAGKVVLDIASGEGYGSAMLANKAARVFGVDSSVEAIDHARRRYKRENLEFMAGNCADIPLPDQSIDLVVSFETIEHHDQHHEMMLEIKRVLRPTGVLLISSPDKYQYSIEPGYRNPYHVKELFHQEFKQLLGNNFENVAYYGQRIVYGSAAFAESLATPTSSYWRENELLTESRGIARPVYWIALASDARLPELASSVFEQPVIDSEIAQSLRGELDERNELLADLKQVIAERDARLAGLSKVVTERDARLVGLNQVLAERDGQIGTLIQAMAERDGRIASLAQAVGERDAQLAGLNQVLAERNGLIDALHQTLTERDGRLTNFAAVVAERDRRITGLLASTSWRVTGPLRLVVQWMRRALAALQSKSFGAARFFYRRLPLGDARSRLRIKTRFFQHCGWLVGRRYARSASGGETAGFAGGAGSHDDPHVPEECRDIASYLMVSADELPDNSAFPVTRFMFYIWRSRLDLRSAFDLHDPQGRIEYCRWFSDHAPREYGFEEGRSSAVAVHGLAGLRDGRCPERANAQKLIDGANLIGYARGEFGMGEVVRTAARAFSASGVPFSVINYAEVGGHGSADDGVDHWIVDTPSYVANIFHINADLLPPLYFRFGRAFFEQRFNIGYWAWELAKCPADFDLALHMVDEVWAISGFVADSFKTRSPVPVLNMPLAVTLPDLRLNYSREYFGLSADDFYFLYIFDAASHLDRKNPVATVRAFKTAFPGGSERVALVLKTMNVRADDPLWGELMCEVATDARIHVINSRLRRDEVLGLNSVCDAFVSLHRSEGFGICLAESMLLGKPLIATNYSGSREFAREGTACVVDFELIPVGAGSYPFWEEQVWAEPDIGHAAFLMRKLFNDEAFRKHMAQAGQRHIQENFNADVIGRRYASRFGELSQRGFQKVSRPAGRTETSGNVVAQSDDEIEGFLDLPRIGESGVTPQSGAVDVAGWAVSRAGMERVEINCDEKFVEDAHYGVLRPDVADMFPGFANPGRSGFFSKLDATKLSDGRHVLKVFAHSRSGKSRGWAQEFTVVTGNAVYAQWLARNTLTPEQRRALCAENDAAPPAVRFSIVAMAGAGIDGERLSRTLESLNGQLYGDWELVLCVDKAGEPVAKKFLESSSARARVSLAGFTGRTWKELFDMCRGNYIGVIGLGDVLDPRALVAVAKNVSLNPDGGLVYADEDRLQDGDRVEPRFKPAWSPIYLQSYNYIGRPWFGSAPALRGVAIAGEQCNDASEHSLLLRLGKTVAKIIHIPLVLCSRPADTRPASVGGEAPARGVVSESACEIRPSPDPARSPMVSVVIPTCLRNLDVVEKCFSSLLMRTDYPNVEVLVVVNNVADEGEAARFLKRWPFRVLSWDGPFNWSGINNFGARSAAGEFLLFMNDDVEALNRNWLAEMVAMANQRLVGAVGAMLVYPNGSIQHGGLCFVSYGGGARHFFRFCRGTEAHIAPMATHSRECSAVTGACLLSRRDVFESVRGFDERLPLIANDADYCLRLGDQGFACVVAAGAKLVHHEGTSRAGMSETRDVDGFWERWRERLESGDPFSNPNLDDQRDDWQLNPDAIGSVIGRIRVGGGSPTVESGS